MRVNLINKNKSSTKVGNVINAVNLDDLIVVEEIGFKKYKIYSPYYRLFFNRVNGTAFEISFIKNRFENVENKENVLFENKESFKNKEIVYSRADLIRDKIFSAFNSKIEAHKESEITFDEIEIEIPEACGKEVYCFNDESNLIIWDALNITTIDVIRTLIKEKKIRMEICDKSKYENCCLDLPVTSNFKIKHEKPHWIPVALKLSNNES